MGQVFNGIGMKYNRRKKIDTEGLGDDLKNHEEFYKNGKYTRKGRKALAGIHSIEEVQDNGAQYNIDTSTGKYHVIDPSIDKAIYSDLAQTGRHVFNNRILRDDTRVAVNAAQDGFTSDIESDEVIAMRVKNARTVIKNKKTEAANAELAAEKKNNKSVKAKDKEKEKDDKKEVSVQGAELAVEVKPVITVADVNDNTEANFLELIITEEGASAFFDAYKSSTPTIQGINTTMGDIMLSIMKAETSSMKGRNSTTKSWDRYKTGAGSIDIGFGNQLYSEIRVNKMTDKEVAEALAGSGMSDLEVIKKTREDLAGKLAIAKKVYTNWATKQGKDFIPFDKLPTGIQGVMMDIQYNARNGVAGYPTLMGHASRGDWAGVGRESGTTYSIKGKKFPMKSRNAMKLGWTTEK